MKGKGRRGHESIPLTLTVKVTDLSEMFIKAGNPLSFFRLSY